MKIIACLGFATIFSINACWAQIAIVDQSISSAVGAIVASYLNQPSRTTYAPVELPSSVASSFNVASTTGVTSDSSVLNAISTTSSAAVTLSTTTSPISPTSVTTSTPTSQPSTTSTANPPSATPFPGLSASAKVGIGLGVPLGVIGLATIGFLVQRHRRHKKASRLRHHGNVAATGLYPAIDETDNVREEDKIDAIDVEDSSGLQGLERNGVHEIHGTEIPAYSRELAGSPGVRRQKSPPWHGSA